MSRMQMIRYFTSTSYLFHFRWFFYSARM